MKRKLIYYRISPFTPARCQAVVICGISSRFQLLSPCNSQIAHALLTRPPLGELTAQKHLLSFETEICLENCSAIFRRCLNVFVQPTRPVRLACLKHAASVRPEPGSNSIVLNEFVLQCLLAWQEKPKYHHLEINFQL